MGSGGPFRRERAQLADPALARGRVVAALADDPFAPLLLDLGLADQDPIHSLMVSDPAYILHTLPETERAGGRCTGSEVIFCSRPGRIGTGDPLTPSHVR